MADPEERLIRQSKTDLRQTCPYATSLANMERKVSGKDQTPRYYQRAVTSMVSKSHGKAEIPQLKSEAGKPGLYRLLDRCELFGRLEMADVDGPDHLPRITIGR